VIGFGLKKRAASPKGVKAPEVCSPVIFSMLEEPGEERALAGAPSVQGGLMNQEMKERVVGSGNRATQASLAGLFLFPFRKMLGLLEQVIGIGHRGSCPG